VATATPLQLYIPCHKDILKAVVLLLCLCRTRNRCVWCAAYVAVWAGQQQGYCKHRKVYVCC